MPCFLKINFIILCLKEQSGKKWTLVHKTTVDNSCSKPPVSEF